MVKTRSRHQRTQPAKSDARLLRQRSRALVWLGILGCVASCDPPAPNSVLLPRDVQTAPDVAALVLVHPVAVDVAETATPDAEMAANSPVRVVHQPPTMHVERVAALDANTLIAVSHERLYRVREGAWEELQLDGAHAQSVLSANHALWVLAIGVGANDGRTLILRSEDADTFTPVLVVRAPARDSGVWAARSFATNRLTNTWWIGGANPTLLRVDALGAVRVEADFAVPELRSIFVASDESVVGLRSDGDFEVIRYGERSTVVGDGHLLSIADEFGASFVIHEDGSVWRGRPARELRRIASRAPFEPRAATMLADGKPVLVGAGGPLATWRGGQWQVVPGEWPADPVAITATNPPIVVGRDGTVVVAESTARVLVRTATVETAPE